MIYNHVGARVPHDVYKTLWIAATTGADAPPCGGEGDAWGNLKQPPSP